MYCSDVIYDGMNPNQIESLPPTQPHRPVDLVITEADKEGYVKSYIVIPGIVYGITTGPFVEAGIQNLYSIGIALFIKGALVRREVGMIGKGLAKWTNVHIDDLVELFIILFKTILSNPEKIGHGREGYFFAGNGERTWFDLP